LKKIILLFILASLSTFAQKKNDSYNYHIKRAASAIKIDGILDENAWQSTEIATDFFQVLPMDTSKAKGRTEVKMCYDDQNLYFTIINYNSHSGDYVVESLKPDFNFGKNDNNLIFLDTFNDQTNGFSFGSNAAGARWEGLMFDGAKMNLSWENRWFTAVKADKDKWIWEAAVPFKTLRYKKGIKSWGINFSRLDVKTTEKSSWTPIPRQFPTASLAFTGNLVWDEDLPTSSSNFAIIPYVLGGISTVPNTGKPAEFKQNVGFDAKAALGPALNLDLTVNPDFSQVEVDRQVTNLDRFELLFPERRQFFLENGDLFSNFGFQTIRPFFSRRIGLNAPIQFGTRLSGKINKDWRISAMDMQTAKTKTDFSQNYAVLAVQRKLFARSNIGAMFVNREAINTGEANPASFSKSNRNLALEYNLASKNNAWNGKAFYFKTLNNVSNNDVMALFAQYNQKKYSFSTSIEKVGAKYNPEVGYTPRRDYTSVYQSASYLFFPKGGKVLSHGPSTGLGFYFDQKMTKQVENELFLGHRFNFRNTSTFMAWVSHNYVNLLQDFDPTGTNAEKMKKSTEHAWNAIGFDFTSKPQSKLTYALSTRFGGFYADGTRTRITPEIGYRFQPYVAITMSANYNHLAFKTDPRLPSSLVNKSYDLWLIGPRIDVTLTNKLFFTNFLQYNNQANNVNLNSRLQWRYSPASDLFIVYTDNYLPNFMVKNRAIVLKFTYWWNV
jgi:Domain of unknown function (DUF5916)/Carbohydrate family 9 binding domain-like